MRGYSASMTRAEAATSPRWSGIHAFIEAELAANAVESVAPLPRAEEAGLDDFLHETVLRFEQRKKQEEAPHG